MTTKQHADRKDIIISELMDALELILAEAQKPEASRHYIMGLCQGASARCNSSRERNADGYMVVR